MHENLARPLSLTKVSTDWREKRITGNCPLALRRVRIRVMPRFGGRIQISFPLPGTAMDLFSSCFLSRQRPRLDEDGFVTVYSDQAVIQAMVTELPKKGSRICRGWIRVSTSQEETVLDPGGRYVTVHRAAQSRVGAITARPPDWWRFGPPGCSGVYFREARARRIWMPESGAGLVALTSTGVPIRNLDSAVVGDIVELQ